MDRIGMCAGVVTFRSRASLLAILAAPLLWACGDDGGQVVIVTRSTDAGMERGGAREDGMIEAVHGCDRVEVDGDLVIEREVDFTARFKAGEPYERTIMLFGGEAVEDDNALGNAYVIGLDKTDALMLAEKYPDFYLCSSPGGMEASTFIEAYDLVPADCDVYDQLVAALRQYARNVASGGDRTSLWLEGAPLELESVTADATGEDVTDQVSDQDFHLITAVEQLTGQSVISFGQSP